MKTKQQLLAVIEQMYACWEARSWVEKHPSQSAEQIGASCQRPEWLVWFLWKRLTPRGRQLFADRLGMRRRMFYGGFTYDEIDMETGQRPAAAYDNAVAASLDRAVINDCWRAWCRS